MKQNDLPHIKHYRNRANYAERKCVKKTEQLNALASDIANHKDEKKEEELALKQMQKEQELALELVLKQSQKDLKQSQKDQEIVLKQSQKDHEIALKRTQKEQEIVLKKTHKDHKLAIKKNKKDEELTLKQTHKLLQKEIAIQAASAIKLQTKLEKKLSSAEAHSLKVSNTLSTRSVRFAIALSD